MVVVQTPNKCCITTNRTRVSTRALSVQHISGVCYLVCSNNIIMYEQAILKTTGSGVYIVAASDYVILCFPNRKSCFRHVNFARSLLLKKYAII